MRRAHGVRGDTSLSRAGWLDGGVPARDLGAAKNAAYVRRSVRRVDRR
jgi:hypothetical protein